ncbi:glutamine--fructose-6-phosphate transaminase (isomerizing) [Mobilitalea sibirica]|uniref:Glutamine--fructose-6-phosphate aminotransferase [isomerizing] n=1 Tax=Mobilitalea sibirica TaxID=1462919 RepID=A0A8J7H2E9_9FIRM|nr:glutamine--fructose-6-phosphate transaminase (isomerizing) [Mobilitalea sibirica]MBH1940665.1 glutamine--fructose-6-phosphate transaminase (isomerizing) [Mobilitalea sibirica]
MCGIIGFTGELAVKNVLLEGLQALEYRGYDSAGIAFFDKDGIKTIKTTGKVMDLKNMVDQASVSEGTCGIGHTRWATHGGVTNTNSHPHTYGKVTLIHNGIIENYHELETELAATGRYPVSQTDTEIVSMLLDSLYQGDAYEAIKKAVVRLEGAYAFCILFADDPDVIYCIRNGSPLVACHSPEGSVIASDMVALIKYSKDYFVLPEEHIAKLTKNGIVVTNFNEEVVTPDMLHVNWDVTAAQKGGYPHFMLKEIHEQPESIRATILPRIRKGVPDFTADNIPGSIFDGVNRIIITACGTAMHAGLVGRIMIEQLLRIPVTVEIASEFRYQNPIMDKNTLVITISQSGETADTLAALRLAKEKHATTLSVVNVKGSSIARESDYVLYTHAGPEIAVASTKAYTAQLACLYMIAFQVALYRGTITVEQGAQYIKELQAVIPAIEETLTYADTMNDICKSLVNTEDLFFIGRGLDYALSCEGSIKLKEISYIHSEAYAAGELKHGTLSLITEGVPVVALVTQENVSAKMISNIREVRARGAMVIMITNGIADADDTIYDYNIKLPKTSDSFAPFTAAIILQMLAYYTSVHRGHNVDQPRNLAKSVTVE